MRLKQAIRKSLGDDTISKINNLLHYRANKKLEVLRKNFYQKFVKQGDLCFDVGANVGNRIAPLLEIGAKIVAVEPQEDCIKRLKSKFGKRINLVTKGLCEEECVRTFHIANANTISSFSKEWINSVKENRFKQFNWDKTVEVQMTTLDKLIFEYGTPDFIKIDVEGYELEVLKGLSKPIKMISFEYTVPEQTAKLIECIKTVQAYSPNILCNFSQHEEMEFFSDQWFKVDEFIELVKTAKFSETLFGDIYFKNQIA